MTLAAMCLSSASWVSNELFAEPVSRPSTSAAMVAIRPIPTFTTSFESALRWFSGKTVRKNMPRSAPPKMHAKVIPAISRELIPLCPPFANAHHSLRLDSDARHDPIHAGRLKGDLTGECRPALRPSGEDTREHDPAEVDVDVDARGDAGCLGQHLLLDVRLQVEIRPLLRE